MPQFSPRRRPVVGRCIEQITDLIRSESLSPGDRLPSIRALALSTGASMVTVFKALHQMLESGTIEKAATRAFMVGTVSQSAEGNCAAVVKLILRPRQRVAEALCEDIRGGFFPPGKVLPSLKVLRHRYRTSHRTIRKALGTLTGRGIVTQQVNGQLSVPAFTTPVRSSRIVCLVESIDSYAMAFGRNDEALFRALELMCEQARIRLDVYLVFADIDFMVHRLRHRDSGRIYDAEDLTRSSDDPSVLGYVHFIPWTPGQFTHRSISVLSGLKKPLAVVDETSLMQIPALAGQKPWVRKFTVATGDKPARDVSQHLLSQGHRRVAFVSADHQHEWSRSRLGEVSRVFQEKGGEVIPCTAETEMWPFHGAATRCDFSSFDTFYAQWRETLLPAFRIEIDRAVKRLHVDTFEKADHRCALFPLFEKALILPAITAWVAVNDETAVMAVEFIKEKGYRIPRDLSLISFDDTAEAMRNNLTSYQYNTPAIAAEIMGFILGRKPFTDSTSVETGFIVDRGSTSTASDPS